MAKRKWSGLSTHQRAGEIRGGKWPWVAVSFINFTAPTLVLRLRMLAVRVVVKLVERVVLSA